MKFRNRSLPWTWFGWRALALSTVFIAAAVVSAQGQMQFQRLKSFGIAGQQGAVPFAPLIQASDGALYGTTEGGGNRGQGTVFRLNPDGSGYTELKSFSGASGDGGSPKAALVQGGDGALYGTTDQGGSNLGGTGNIPYRLSAETAGSLLGRFYHPDKITADKCFSSDSSFDREFYPALHRNHRPDIR